MLRVLLSPRALAAHLLVILAVAATGGLGVWQYGVWHEHRKSQAMALAHAPAKPLQRVMGPDDPFPRSAVGQPVRFHGVWVPQESFLVSGKQLHGRSGYWAVTPLAVCDGSCGPRASARPAMLVVRGWTPSARQAPAPPPGPVQVTGWLQPAEGSAVPDTTPHDDVLPALEIVSALQRVHQDLYGAYVMSRGGGPGLSPLTPAVLPGPDPSTSLRNILYAIQWWVFAGFAVFVWWRWCADQVAGDRRSRDATAPEVASGP